MMLIVTLISDGISGHLDSFKF